MKKAIFFLVGLAILAAGCKTGGEASLTSFVDPFIGTGGFGHTHPSAQLPFSMVQVGPNTDDSKSGKQWEHCSGYHYDEKTIIGFTHTHLSGTGCEDMGDILIMPVTGEPGFVQGKKEDTSTGYRSGFSHDSEEAHPGYYKVKLDDYNVVAEMTASPRVGFHRYTFPQSDDAGFIIDLGFGEDDGNIASHIKAVDNQTVTGFRRSHGFVDDHHYYFTAKFSVPFESVETFVDGAVSDAKEAAGTVTKMRVRFATKENQEVLVKVALSTFNEEGAARNLEAEIPGWDFDAVRKNADDIWNTYLGKVEIKARNDEERTSFYTGLYHSLIMPNLVTDVDGSYVGWDRKEHKSARNLYTNFSLWDTYRAEHPFLEILYPDDNSGFVESLIERHRQTGLLVTNEYGLCETWCMIGNHAVPVIADAYIKGDRSFNADDAWDAVKTAMTTDHNKSDWSNYDKLGYFPNDDKYYDESVSRTMEACYNDYCAAVFAKALGKEDDYRFFLDRSQNYRNLFDKEYKLARGRNDKGQWRTPFEPRGYRQRDYTEGNAWQYTWHVQNDPMGLIGLFDSKEEFVNKLDSLYFIDSSAFGMSSDHNISGMIGTYAHGNEPSHHIAYLYTLAGHPEKTAEVVREVFDKLYMPAPDGLCGNDDCGQMSCWYMFSAFGFYPVNPISGEYVFGAPQLHEATLHLPNGKTFSIKANGLSEENKFVGEIRLNGKKVDYTTIRYDDIMAGGTLEYDMISSAR